MSQPSSTLASTVVSRELSRFITATSSAKKTGRNIQQAQEAISSLKERGIILQQFKGKWAALIKSPISSWRGMTDHIDEVRNHFSRPNYCRVFLEHPEDVLPSSTVTYPYGAWEFAENDLSFTPASVDCYHMKCQKPSASATLTTSMLLKGGYIDLGARRNDGSLRGTPYLLITQLCAPEATENPSLEADVHLFQKEMIEKMKNSSAAQKFQQSVGYRNLTAASKHLASMQRAAGVASQWTGSHEWTVKVAPVKLHPILNWKTSSDEDDNMDNFTSTKSSDTETDKQNTPSPTETMESWDELPPQQL